MRHRHRTPFLVRALVLLVVVVFVSHRFVSHWMGHRKWVEAPIAHVQRTCPPPRYPTILDDEPVVVGSTLRKRHAAGPKICLTTLTDEGRKSRAVRYFGWRNFDGLLKLTESNKRSYADKHGYFWFDESAMLDKSRPPSWSKIKAVQRLLNEERCDWVFWLDADTVIMDSNRRLESILSKDHDLLVAPDDGGGYNAGVWLIRNTEWSKNFLQTWWDMKSFVKPPGLSKSGDNDALKHYLAELERDGEFRRHIAAPARCTFNSFAKFVSPSAQPKQQDDENSQYYMDEGYYHSGDFIAHVAAVDNKVDTIRVMLALAK